MEQRSCKVKDARGRACWFFRMLEGLTLGTLNPFKNTHRLRAWGVLGLATGGFFSLLTLLFSGAISGQTPVAQQSFGRWQENMVRVARTRARTTVNRDRHNTRTGHSLFIMQWA